MVPMLPQRAMQPGFSSYSRFQDSGYLLLTAQCLKTGTLKVKNKMDFCCAVFQFFPHSVMRGTFPSKTDIRDRRIEKNT
jgi:hypothetical protein